MEQGTTTIKVFRDDKVLLTRLYGAPTHEAFQKVMSVSCSHPESHRAYTTAIIPPLQADLLEGRTQAKVYSAFLCGVCQQFIVPSFGVESRVVGHVGG